MQIKYITNEEGWEEVCRAVCDRLAYKYAAQADEMGGILVNRAIKLESYICIIKALKDYVRIFIVKDTMRGFVTHTRSGTVKGFLFPGTDISRTPAYGDAHLGLGYKQDKDTVITLGDIDGTPYPVVDNPIVDPSIVSARKWLFEKDSTAWSTTGPQEILYGNVDWKGPSGESRRILTYKGNPSRYWPLNQYVEIPGLTTIDHIIPSDLGIPYSYTTPFSPYIYEGGSVRAVMPNLYSPTGSEGVFGPAQVLGAAYRQTDGILVCIIKTTTNSLIGTPTTYQVYLNEIIVKDWGVDKAGAEKQILDSNGLYKLVEKPNNGKGYFIEVILEKQGDIEGGWKRLLQVRIGASMPNCNFFFSEDGTKAVSVMLGKLYKIDIIGDSATYTETPVGEFKQNITTSYDSKLSTKEARDAKSGDFKYLSTVTRTYNQAKSGEVIIAADFKGNKYVDMKAVASGGNVYELVKTKGTQWGATAMVPNMVDASDRIPYIASWGYCDGGGGPGTVAFVVYPGGSCKPVITINGAEVDAGECHVLDVGDCIPGASAVVDVTIKVVDTVTGLSATSSGDAQIKFGAVWRYVAGSGQGETWYEPWQSCTGGVSAAVCQGYVVPGGVPGDYITEYTSSTRRTRRSPFSFTSSFRTDGACYCSYDFRSRYMDIVVVESAEAQNFCTYNGGTEMYYYGYACNCKWEEELVCP